MVTTGIRGAALVLMLSAMSCANQVEVSRCYPDDHARDSTNCGCNGPVPAEFRCFAGQSCDPREHARDVLNCGCNGECNSGHVCTDGSCCNPENHRLDDALCFCRGPCAKGERCLDGECICDRKLHLDDEANCGCHGPCPHPGLEECIGGECLCVYSANLDNSANCGCNGACPEQAVCRNGHCECPAGFILCSTGGTGTARCDPVLTSPCACNPEDHVSDAANCGCSGPCGSGERCHDGRCQCDPLLHLEDPFNCGCNLLSGGVDASQPLDCTERFDGRRACQDGQCVCPAGTLWCDGQCTSKTQCCDKFQHLSDVANCACKGPCAEGSYCQNGACYCDPLDHQSDSKNCACKGPCAINKQCDQGACVCQPGFTACWVKDGWPNAGAVYCVDAQYTGAVCPDCVRLCPGSDFCSQAPGSVKTDMKFQCCVGTATSSKCTPWSTE